MEKADKVYLVFGRHAVDPDIDQPIQVKRMTCEEGFFLESWCISYLISNLYKKKNIRRKCRRKHSHRPFQKKVSRNDEENKDHTLTHVREINKIDQKLLKSYY